MSSPGAMGNESTSLRDSHSTDEGPTSGVEGSGRPQDGARNILKSLPDDSARAVVQLLHVKDAHIFCMLAGAASAVGTRSVLESADCWFHTHVQSCSSPLQEWEDGVSEKHRITELEATGRG